MIRQEILLGYHAGRIARRLSYPALLTFIVATGFGAVRFTQHMLQRKAVNHLVMQAERERAAAVIRPELANKQDTPGPASSAPEVTTTPRESSDPDEAIAFTDRTLVASARPTEEAKSPTDGATATPGPIDQHDAARDFRSDILNTASSSTGFLRTKHNTPLYHEPDPDREWLSRFAVPDSFVRLRPIGDASSEDKRAVHYRSWDSQLEDYAKELASYRKYISKMTGTPEPVPEGDVEPPPNFRTIKPGIPLTTPVRDRISDFVDLRKTTQSKNYKFDLGGNLVQYYDPFRGTYHDPDEPSFLERNGGVWEWPEDCVKCNEPFGPMPPPGDFQSRPGVPYLLVRIESGMSWQERATGRTSKIRRILVPAYEWDPHANAFTGRWRDPVTFEWQKAETLTHEEEIGRNRQIWEDARATRVAARAKLNKCRQTFPPPEFVYIEVAGADGTRKEYGYTPDLNNPCDEFSKNLVFFNTEGLRRGELHIAPESIRTEDARAAAQRLVRDVDPSTVAFKPAESDLQFSDMVRQHPANQQSDDRTTPRSTQRERPDSPTRLPSDDREGAPKSFTLVDPRHHSFREEEPLGTDTPYTHQWDLDQLWLRKPGQQCDWSIKYVSQGSFPGWEGELQQPRDPVPRRLTGEPRPPRWLTVSKRLPYASRCVFDSGGELFAAWVKNYVVDDERQKMLGYRDPYTGRVYLFNQQHQRPQILTGKPLLPSLEPHDIPAHLLPSVPLGVGQVKVARSDVYPDAGHYRAIGEKERRPQRSPGKVVNYRRGQDGRWLFRDRTGTFVPLKPAYDRAFVASGPYVHQNDDIIFAAAGPHAQLGPDAYATVEADREILADQHRSYGADTGTVVSDAMGFLDTARVDKAKESGDGQSGQ